MSAETDVYRTQSLSKEQLRQAMEALPAFVRNHFERGILLAEYLSEARRKTKVEREQDHHAEVAAGRLVDRHCLSLRPGWREGLTEPGTPWPDDGQVS